MSSAAERAREAAQLLEDVAAPDRKRTDRAEHEAQPAPTEPRPEKRAQVVEMLEDAQWITVERAAARRLRVHPLRMKAQRHHAGDADDARWVAHRQPHPEQERLAAVHRVAVDAEDVPVAGEIECAVERVGLAAVTLADDRQPRLSVATEDPDERFGVEDAAEEDFDLLERERLVEPLERAVGGAVVNHDQLELGVILLE